MRYLQEIYAAKAYNLSGNQYHYQDSIKSNLFVLIIFLKKILKLWPFTTY
jgi:hypothetical protein